MPYIKPARRKHLDPLIEALMGANNGLSEGDLVYAFCRLLGNHTVELGSQTGASWLDRARALLVLDATKQEWYRRCMSQYEDIKIQENGDVPEFELLAAWSGHDTPASTEVPESGGDDDPTGYNSGHDPEGGGSSCGPADDCDCPLGPSPEPHEFKGL